MFREAERSWLPKGFEFLSGLPERIRRVRRLVVLQAFVDESGGKGQGEILALVSLSAPAEVWAAFADEWDRWLRAGLGIRYFKMSEALGLSGEFSYWREEARNEKLMSLSAVIDRFPLRATNVLIHVRPFQSLITERFGPVKGRDPFGHPYLFALQAMMVALGEDFLDEGHVGARLEVIFDEQHQLSADAKRAFSQIRKFLQPEVEAVLPSEPWFRNDQDFVPLQAADLFAGELRMLAEGNVLGLPETFRGRPFPNLGESQRSRHFDSAALEKSASAIVTLLERLRRTTDDAVADGV